MSEAVEPHRDSLDELWERVSQLEAGAPREDLDLALRALAELVDGSALFARFAAAPKATVFGSARTPSSSGLYTLAHDLSAALAREGWMSVTGAGPGIMEAASKGAGREATIGVNIELPFEHGTNEFVDLERLHIATSFFFTRKVLMTRSAQAFVAFPGGVGTMDELFEVLTLLHTGKTDPVPVVLVDEPGGTFWRAWSDFMTTQVIETGYLSAGDDISYRLVTSVEEALEEILGFHRNFLHARTDGGEARLVVRRALDAAHLARLTERLGRDVTQSEGAEGATVRFAYNGRSYALLRAAIDVVNQSN